MLVSLSFELFRSPGVESRRNDARRRKRDQETSLSLFFLPLGPGGASCVCCVVLHYLTFSCKCVIGARDKKGRKKEPRTFYSTSLLFTSYRKEQSQFLFSNIAD